MNGNRTTEDGSGSRTLVLRPVGRLDRDTCGELRHQLGAAFAVGVRSIAVDLAEVPTADVDGLRVLAGAARHLRGRGGQLVVMRARPAIARMLTVNGMAEMLDIVTADPITLSGPVTIVLPTGDDHMALPG